jgi:hypothetical protein
MHFGNVLPYNPYQMPLYNVLSQSYRKGASRSSATALVSTSSCSVGTRTSAATPFTPSRASPTYALTLRTIQKVTTPFRLTRSGTAPFSSRACRTSPTANSGQWSQPVNAPNAHSFSLQAANAPYAHRRWSPPPSDTTGLTPQISGWDPSKSTYLVFEVLLGLRKCTFPFSTVSLLIIHQKSFYKVLMVFQKYIFIGHRFPFQNAPKVLSQSTSRFQKVLCNLTKSTFVFRGFFLLKKHQKHF